MKRTRRRSSGTRQAFVSQESTPGLRSASAGSGVIVLLDVGVSASSAVGVSLDLGLVGSTGFLAALALLGTGSPRSQTIVPPAASIFSRAVFEKPCAETVSFFVSSPSPRIFTSTARSCGSAASP